MKARPQARGHEAVNTTFRLGRGHGATRLTLCAGLALALAGCDSSGQLDFDLRDNLGDAFDTSPAVRMAVADRPRPDNRGVISYPSYQVAVARRGDTVQDVAARVGLPAGELASYNGLPMDVRLRRGEIVALPRRVAEPSAATGAPAPTSQTGSVTTAALPSTGGVTTQSLEDRANAAINRGESVSGPTAAPAPSQGAEPQRHRVARGETAYGIARQYGVPVSALGEWNGLGSDLTVREGQFLIIPVVTRVESPGESRPGDGSVAPTPPSAAAPLPQDESPETAEEDVPDAPDVGQTTTAAQSGGRFLYPVTGSIIRPYRKGRNDGIDIAATPGTPVKAADAGTVAAITRDTDQVPILVLRHPGNVLTVYAGVEGINVEKGDSISRGQVVARVRDTDPSFLHFEVREGFESVDPVSYLQ